MRDIESGGLESEGHFRTLAPLAEPRAQDDGGTGREPEVQDGEILAAAAAVVALMGREEQMQQAEEGRSEGKGDKEQEIRMGKDGRNASETLR